MRVSVPAARYDTPEKVVDFYRQLNERVRALPGVERRRRARAAAGDDDRRLRPRRRRLRGIARARTPRATGRSSPTARSRRWARGWCAAAGSRRPTPRASQPVAVDQRDDGADLLDESGGRGRRPDSRRRRHERDPWVDRRRHRRRRAAQRRHRHREGEVLRAAQPVARRDRRQPDPRRLPGGADDRRSDGGRRRRCAIEIRELDPNIAGREHPSDDAKWWRRRWRRRG